MNLFGFTGLREQTPFRMIFDAGACVVGINETVLESTGLAAALTTPWTWYNYTVTPRALGATRGGATFDPQKEERQIEVNGARSPLIKMSRVDRVEPVLTVSLLELADINTLKYPLGQANISETPSGYHKVQPKLDISLTDYIPNVALLARTSEDGQEKPVIVVLRNCKVMENSAFTFEDPGEVATEVSFAATNAIENAFDIPYTIYVPVNEDGLGSGS